MPKANPQKWLHPHKLEYVPLNEELAVVRVVAALDRGSRLPADTALVAGAPHSIVRAPVLGSVTHRPSRRMRAADHLLWRVTFALPLELLECPQSVFALAARDRIPSRLPNPELSSLEALCRHWELGPRGASLINGLAWRRAAALGTAVAVAGSSVLPPAVALAAGHGNAHLHHHHAAPQAHEALVVHRTHQAHHPIAASAHTSSSRSTHVVRVKHVVSDSGGITHASKPAVVHSHHHHQQHRRTVQAHPGHHSTSSSTAGGSAPRPNRSPSSGGAASGSSTPTPQPPATGNHGHKRHHHGGHHGVSLAGGSGLSTISPNPPDQLLGNHHIAGRHSLGHVDNPAGHRHTSTTGKRRHHHRLRNASSTGIVSGGAALPSLKPKPAVHLPRPAPEPTVSPTSSTSTSPSSFWTTGMGMSSGEVALLSHLSGLYAKGLQPPAFLIPIYKRAGRRFHIPWQVLAAINSIETNYGRDLKVSSAGAEGWMQFMPSTWAQYGLSVNGHGTPNPYDPTDAIFSAANYLAANGGAHHLRKSIFAYNHAVWYVDSVLWRAGIISDHAQGIKHLGGYALPLDAKYMRAFGRTDDGLDIEDAPDGAAVYSITPGVVTAVASDPGGFGPNYPVIRVTKGPLTGQYIYYGHVAASLVKVGQHVMAGQPIAVMGHTGDAASLGHGHIEIGFSDSAGDPLNHHGAAAWTPSGAAMRRVLVALSAGFHIKVR